jgi:hypothetical protein
MGHPVAMAREIPESVRAVAGLAATVLDEARKLPETLPGLPVQAIGLAMQASLKLQQHYAELVARGDELFTGLLGEQEPVMATFDDEVDDTFDDDIHRAAPATATTPGFHDSAFDRAQAPADEDLDVAQDALEELAIEDLVDAGPTTPDADVEGLANALLEADAAGARAATASSTGSTDTATDQTGAPVAAATGVRTDVGGPDTGEADAAIATGAATDAVGAKTDDPTDDPEGGSELSGSQAAGTAPIDGYDGFSIAQLRGRLRGYAPSTVESLLVYEESTRAREPYLRMLRNRLERVRADSS